MRPFRTRANQARLALQHMYQIHAAAETRAAAVPPVVTVTRDDEGVWRTQDGHSLDHGPPAVAGPAVRQPRHRVVNPWYAPSLFPYTVSVSVYRAWQCCQSLSDMP